MIANICACGTEVTLMGYNLNREKITSELTPNLSR
jgi:hypothetical protein